FKDLGVEKNGDTAEINGVRVRIAAVTHGIRSFTTLPYVFTSLKQARMLLDAGGNQASYTLVSVSPDADLETVRQDLINRLQ
ncbi:ABC transporter permease, partial [Microbacteriaceae bacterium K1510]|nr:ABC transporter permease [Microbacteriaceae bacterium K1510]